MAFDKTIYAVHPVAPEVKAEANKHGYRLLDARFAPEGEPLMDGQTGERIAGSAATLDLTREGIAVMDKPELFELLEANGAEFDKRWGVERLREALIAIVFVEA